MALWPASAVEGPGARRSDSAQEQVKVHGVGHGLVSGVVRVQVVTAVVGGQEPSRLRGISESCIEVDDGVERSPRPNPLIYRLPLRFALGCEISRIDRAFERGQGAAIDPQMVSVCPSDQLVEPSDDRVRADRLEAEGAGQPDIVDSGEHNDVPCARPRQNIAVEATEAAWAHEVVQNAIARDALVEHTDATVMGAGGGIEPLREKVRPAMVGIGGGVRVVP